MPAIDDLRDLLDHQRRAIESSEPGVRDGADPESLHRFRVATRRSRALIRASRPLVRDQLASLDRELRWLGGVSGPVRDLDVLVDHLGGMLDELGEDRAGAESIIAELEKERAAQRAILVEALDTDRFRLLLDRFDEALPTLRVMDAGSPSSRSRNASTSGSGRDTTISARIRATTTFTPFGSGPSMPATLPSSRRWDTERS